MQYQKGISEYNFDPQNLKQRGQEDKEQTCIKNEYGPKVWQKIGSKEISQTLKWQLKVIRLKSRSYTSINSNDK